MKLQPKFTIEPGDGTGSSIADGCKRNEFGKCGTLGCLNNLIDGNGNENFCFLGVAFCENCSGPLKKLLYELYHDL